jgi:hypothetical protein
MGDVVELKRYVPIIEQLRSRLDELPDWCRDAVGWLITMNDFGVRVSQDRATALRKIRKAIDECEFMPATEEE